MKPTTKVVTQSITCIVIGHRDLALGRYHWDLEPDYNYVHCWHVGKGELYNWLYQQSYTLNESDKDWFRTRLIKYVTTWLCSLSRRMYLLEQGRNNINILNPSRLSVTSPRNRACNYKRIQGTHLHAPRVNPHSTCGLDIRSSGRNNGIVIFRI